MPSGVIAIISLSFNVRLKIANANFLIYIARYLSHFHLCGDHLRICVIFKGLESPGRNKSYKNTLIPPCLGARP